MHSWNRKQVLAVVLFCEDFGRDNRLLPVQVLDIYSVKLKHRHKISALNRRHVKLKRTQQGFRGVGPSSKFSEYREEDRLHSIYSPAMFMYCRWIIRFDDEYITSNVYPESFARGQSLKMRWCKGLHARLMSHKAGPRLIPLYDRITFLSKTLASSIASKRPPSCEG